MLSTLKSKTKQMNGFILRSMHEIVDSILFDVCFFFYLADACESTILYVCFLSYAMYILVYVLTVRSVHNIKEKRKLFYGIHSNIRWHNSIVREEKKKEEEKQSLIQVKNIL